MFSDVEFDFGSSTRNVGPENSSENQQHKGNRDSVAWEYNDKKNLII